MKINELVNVAHNDAKAKGWWDQPKSLPELICLVHSELSEALEEVRNGRAPNETYYSGKITHPLEDGGYVVVPATTTIVTNACTKPEGVPSELADVIIRIGDICGYYGIDLEAIIKQKLEYNKSRSYRHGNKVL